MTEALRTEAESQGLTLTPPVGERDHAQGPATAAVILVEFGDYRDPECASAQSRIKALQARMGDRLRFVFRHFPATGLYPHAAEAAEAAGLQGRFWPMHDTLLEHHSALGNGHLVEYAHGLGLDVSRFLRDLTGHVSAERLRSDRESGALSGVRDTPTFFVNGVRQAGPWEARLVSISAATPDDAGEVDRWADDGAPTVPNGVAGENCEESNAF